MLPRRAHLRDYDNNRKLITTIYGTNDIVEDVKQVYLEEFEEAHNEYNAKTSKDINRILYNLKPTLMNKNNMVISSKDVQKIKNFTKDVKDTNKTVRSVNDLIITK